MNYPLHLTSSFSSAMYNCILLFIQLLHEMPLEERQIDIGLLIEQYEQILMSLASKEDPSLATLVEGVAMLTRLLKAQDRSGLQLLLTKYSMIETLLKVSFFHVGRSPNWSM